MALGALGRSLWHPVGCVSTVRGLQRDAMDKGRLQNTGFRVQETEERTLVGSEEGGQNARWGSSGSQPRWSR